MTDTSELRGIIGATLTPFTEDGGVDDAAADQLTEFMVTHCDAVSVLGAEASEYQVLTPSERRRSLTRSLRQIGGRVPAIAGASSPSWREVVELSELAAAGGASLVQVLMPRRPWGGEPSTTELITYFETVAARTAVPVVAYHNPTRGADPPVEAFVRISQIDRVAAFKESARDMSKIGRLIHEIDLAGNARYFTTMQPLLQTLLLGGAGAMMPPPGTVMGAEVVRAVRDGDLERATAAQQRFATFPHRWRSYGLSPVMKAAMRHLGVDLGGPAAPFNAVTDADAVAIAEFLDTAGVRRTDTAVRPDRAGAAAG